VSLDAVAGGGNNVTLTATPGCTGTPEYLFWYLPPGGSWTQIGDWQSDATATWDTTGLADGYYTLNVWARDEGGTWEAYGLAHYWIGASGNCASATPTLLATPASPQFINTLLTLTASATCDVGVTPEYLFWYLPPAGSWTQLGTWQTSTTHDLDTTGFAAGTYNLIVWVRGSGSGGSWESYGQTYFDLTVEGTCASGGLAASPDAPQPPGTTLTLTGSGTCDVGVTPQYLFWYLAPGASSYSQLGNWQTNTQYVWDTTSLPNGTYTLVVWIRAAGSSASYETYGLVTYQLDTGSVGVCSSVDTFTASEPVGGIVTLTTVASCTLGAEAEYLIWYLPPAGSWTQVGVWHTSTSYEWDTGGLPSGSYALDVWARRSGSSGSWESYALLPYTL